MLQELIKALVFHLEACDSGSIFEGLLPEAYCPGDDPSAPPEYHQTCLGDLYSLAWMEDSDAHNLRAETLQKQYELVKKRTTRSHVMQYGDIALSKDALFAYFGTNPANDNFTFVDVDSLQPPTAVVNQRDADLVYFLEKYRKAPEGSAEKTEAQKQLVEIMSCRMRIDHSVKLIGMLLFERGPEVLNTLLVSSFYSLPSYLRRHFAMFTYTGVPLQNICNARIQTEQMVEASAQACASIPIGH
uniref:Uncharacterized protein n=1 Tax=Gossypium raimondii TaxID=29730 RepID=A0A0D2Q940_GOSRA|nr:hypothetical protein B456_009G046900 [Gossypium raimondii]